MKILMKTRTPRRGISRTLEWAGLMLVALCLLAPSRTEAAGSWTRLASDAPGNVCLMLLLSDGSVMAFNNQPTFLGIPDGYGQGYYFLTPDSNGSYVNGSWTTDNSKMNDSRLWYSSQVLTNGSVFIAGGEYGSGGDTAELFDPLTSVWSKIPVPAGLINTGPSGDSENSGFRDSGSVMLPNGM